MVDQQNIDQAIFALMMHQCPYYQDPNHGVCARNASCWTVGEPVCQTSEPTDGWIEEAIGLLIDEDPGEADDA